MELERRAGVARARHRPVSKVRTDGVLVIAGEAPHHLLQVQAEVVARLVDRQVLRLRHPWRAWGAPPPRPPGIKGSNHPNNQMVDHEPPRTARTKLLSFLLTKFTNPLKKPTPHAKPGRPALVVDDQ